jgi:predicted Zn finger-like uncharacterized protein
MVITCEKCQTRFELDETRVPPKGARVRCSRCQHRFHVKPPEARLSPDEIAARALQDSPAPTATAPARSAASRDEVGDLDNPEFLFDGPTPEAPRPAAAARRAPAASPPPAAKPARGARPAAASREPVDPFEEPASGVLLAAASEEGGSSAVGMDPGALLNDPETLVETDAADEHSARSMLGQMGGDLDPQPERESWLEGAAFDPASISPAREAPREPAPRSAPKPAETRASAAPAPVTAHAAPAVAPLESVQRTAVEPGAGAREEAWNGLAPLAPPDDRMRLALRLVAVAVGAALALGTARALWLFEIRGPLPVERVEAAGWTATGIDAFHLTGAAGERVLMVRGDLVSSGDAWLPEIRVQLLDDGGQSIGLPFRGEPVRLAGAALSPAEISARIAAAAEGAPAAAPAQSENHFTVLLPHPPGAATHYRLELAVARP